MPVMDGMRLLERMYAAGHLAQTVVAVVTTEESAETEREARARGASHFLRKPVNRRTVEQVLAKVFDLPELAGGK
jgi:CheY-like chemotaxis protein